MKAQEAFTAAVKGVLGQGGPSARLCDNGKQRCLFRGPNGRRCAVGWVLPEEALALAPEDLETMDVRELVARFPVLVFEDMSEDSSVDFLEALQRAHDDAAFPSSRATQEDSDFLPEFRRRGGVQPPDAGVGPWGLRSPCPRRS